MAAIIARGVQAKSILEVGGGIGHLQIELLEAGATRSVNVELSRGYEETARTLLESEGLLGRVERRLGDFVEEHETIAVADIVLLDKVICCYPWVGRMVDAAAAKTRESMALILPRDHRMAKTLIALENTWHRLRRSGFRGYVHDVGEIDARARAAGMTRVYLDRGPMWQAMIYARSG